MIHLDPQEKILMVLHRHWIVILEKIIVGAFLLLFPLIAVPLLAVFFSSVFAYTGAVMFLFVVYFMIVVLVIFVFWIEYYLDVWIITTDRIIDIEQRSLFNREISEFRLKNVQDVTIEIPGMLAAFLKFGNIVIQTAGEKSFSIKQIPRAYEAKNLILDNSKQSNSHVRAQ